MNNYIMKELDHIYNDLEGHWKECANGLINKYDETGLLHPAEIEIASGIVELKLSGRI